MPADGVRGANSSRWYVLNSARRVKERLEVVLRHHGLMVFFALEVIGITFLQKFAVQFDVTIFGTYISVGAVQVAMPIFYAGILFLFAFARPKVDIIRLGLFSVLLIVVAISLALQKAVYSQASVLLMIACYAPFIFKVDVSGRVYRKMLSIYLNVMIVVCVIVIAQQLSQLAWTWRSWPNLDILLPPAMQFPGFNYIQPITYGSKFMKPHGIFFLEVSTVSQFIAIAFAIEMVYFRRVFRLAFYVVVLLITFAGTGPLLLLLCAPVLFAKLSPKSILLVLLVFGLGFFAADRIHWYQQVQGRFSEYEKQGSSAHLRFVDPLLALADSIRSPEHILSGIGPGNTAKDDGTVSWAATKVAVEYGFVGLISFSIFVGYVLFSGAPSQRLAFVLAVFFNFMAGGIVIPIYPIMIFLFGGLFRVEGGASDRAASKSATAVDMPGPNAWIRPAT